MSARLLTVCLILSALMAVTATRLGAKPPDLLIKAVEFKDSTPEPLPVPAEAPRTAATPSKAAASPIKMVTKVYPVADLVIPSGGDNKAPVKTTEEQLMNLISATVEPESWAAKGGKGAIAYYPLTLSLTVSQTAEVHTKIGEMLESLRKLQDVQVAVEVRFLSVSETMFANLFINAKKDNAKDEPTACGTTSCEKAAGQKLGHICGIAPCKEPAPKGVAFLSDKQLHLLMEALQADQHTKVMQAPKITMANGQPAEMAVEEQREFVTGLDVSRKDDQLVLQPKTESVFTGLKMALMPVVSADKRFVRINVNATETTLDSEKVPLIPVSMSLLPEGGDKTNAVTFNQFVQNPKFTTLTVDKTLTLPDGGTALFHVGKRTREVEHDSSVPLLAELPYVGRLFRKTAFGKETECVLMLVTPRIIVVEEEEQPKQATATAPKTLPRGGSYEQEEPACCQKARDCCAAGAACCPPCCAVTGSCCAHGADPKVAELMRSYYKACAEGRRAEATQFAVQALALDPMCFGKEHGGKGK